MAERTRKGGEGAASARRSKRKAQAQDRSRREKPTNNGHQRNKGQGATPNAEERRSSTHTKTQAKWLSHFSRASHSHATRILVRSRSATNQGAAPCRKRAHTRPLFPPHGPTGAQRPTWPHPIPAATAPPNKPTGPRRHAPRRPPITAAACASLICTSVQSSTSAVDGTFSPASRGVAAAPTAPGLSLCCSVDESSWNGGCCTPSDSAAATVVTRLASRGWCCSTASRSSR